MRSGDREPVQGGEGSSRTLLLWIVAVIILLLLGFLVLRPRGPEASAPQNKTMQH